MSTGPLIDSYRVSDLFSCHLIYIPQSKGTSSVKIDFLGPLEVVAARKSPEVKEVNIFFKTH